MRGSVALKATLVITVIGVMASFGQFTMIRWALADAIAVLASHGVGTDFGDPLMSKQRPRLIFALTGPFFVGATICGLIAAGFVRRRVAPLTDALRRIAAGDYAVRLPPATESELAVVSDAFEAMRGALDFAVSRVEYASLQRRRLFADLAHELGTPTTTILTIADAFADPVIDSVEGSRSRLIRSLQQEATRLQRLILDVRDLAILDDPELSVVRRPTEISAIAQAAAERLAVARQGLAPISCCTTVVWASIDEVRLDQVFVNLLSNAQRYAPKDGMIRVTVAPDGDAVRIEVEDSGRGVPDELLPRLGERLFRPDPSRDRKTGGHGLGLSIVRAVVECHEGTVVFSRSSLGGLRVAIRLPRCEPAAAPTLSA